VSRSVSEIARTSVSEGGRKVALARPIDESAVQVTLWHDEPKGAGPWSFVTDVPTPGRRMAGPPPGFLALAGWATSTILHAVGVAHRGHIPLEDVTAAFRVRRKVDGVDPEAFSVTSAITFTGNIDDQQLLRLERTAKYCPVGVYFQERTTSIQDQVDLPPLAEPAIHRTSEGPREYIAAFAPGDVTAAHLRETREWRTGLEGEMLGDEGEVKLHLTCEDAGRTGRWSLIGGHTSEGWVPRPADLALAALAASTVGTLRPLAQTTQLGPADVQVLVRNVSGDAGGKEAIVARMLEGKSRQISLTRAITLRAPFGEVNRAAVDAALAKDPVSRYLFDGNILTGEEITVDPAARVNRRSTDSRR
jgi:uncharacterized OsmC-like protein